MTLPPGMGDHKKLFVDDDNNAQVMDSEGNVKKMGLEWEDVGTSGGGGGGGDGSSLSMTDGDLVVNPVTSIYIDPDTMQLYDDGDGEAFISATPPPPIPHPRFISISKYIYDEMTDISNYINFHERNSHDIGYTPAFYTNDWPDHDGYGEMGWDSASGHDQLPYNATWETDHFDCANISDTDTIFRIKSRGIYLLEASAYQYSGFTEGGDYTGHLQLDYIQDGTPDELSFGMTVGNRARFVLNDGFDGRGRAQMTLQKLVFIRGNGGPVPVKLIAWQDSGSTSVDGPSTAQVRCVRLTLPGVE